VARILKWVALSGSLVAAMHREFEKMVGEEPSSAASAERACFFCLREGYWRILTGMKRWYLYLMSVPLGLAGLAYLMVRWNFPINFTEMWSGTNDAKETQSAVEKTRDGKTVHDDLLEAIRRRHDLRPLTKQEDGTTIQDLPNGVYGFSICDVPSLSAKRNTTFPLEIHKKHDGIVYYVGYASSEDIAKYLTHQKQFHILMYPHAWDTTSSLLEIPVAFISKCESRSVRDGYLFDLFVADIPESPD